MTRQLDITREHCPMTMVKVKLALDKIAAGESLEVLLAGGEPLESVPRTAVEQGHKVLTVNPDGTFFRVVIQK